ncbi:DEAD/DEAH box helicase [Oceanicola sp. 22II-s10i]|uniref:DEAD/DEAH box helicase n=1 Tax=Oceanicola sp. 22II-s10i TaxID=1317116 RepID=UPI000B525FA8|nr:DEAD/DEAH box helicase [Oceanicola sp. 22II-s10i]OWU84073.1 DEAD/DEAH box helicase [Oceanicola sp. 22II-s10i]
MLGLPSRLSANLTELGITDPTPIQRQAIPHAMNGRDVMGLAQTGTGKTAAFGLPILTALMRAEGKPAPRSARSLILAPTRELAKQILDSLRGFAKGTSVRIELIVGGGSINAQVQRMQRGTDVLVATPGRLIDLIDRNAVRLDETVFLVLDEADQMLDMGFIHALRRIAPLLPKERQTMLFSATMPKLMADLSRDYLTNPVRIETNPPGKPADKIDQHVHFVAQAAKSGLLIEHLGEHTQEAALVFARTKHGAERLMKSLVNAGFGAASIHGNKSQGQRDRALKAFKDGEIKVLVATDVAARGIDIPDVRYVYNYDLPNVPDNYVHRIGRTARAGRDGTAIAYCAPAEMSELRDIQKVMGREIPVAGGTPWEPQPGEEPKRQGRGGGKPGGNRGGAGGGGRGKPGRRGGGKPGQSASAAPGGAPAKHKPRRSRPNRGKANARAA